MPPILSSSSVWPAPPAHTPKPQPRCYHMQPCAVAGTMSHRADRFPFGYRYSPRYKSAGTYGRSARLPSFSCTGGTPTCLNRSSPSANTLPPACGRHTTGSLAFVIRPHTSPLGGCCAVMLQPCGARLPPVPAVSLASAGAPPTPYHLHHLAARWSTLPWSPCRYHVLLRRASSQASRLFGLKLSKALFCLHQLEQSARRTRGGCALDTSCINAHRAPPCPRSARSSRCTSPAVSVQHVPLMLAPTAVRV